MRRFLCILAAVLCAGSLMAQRGKPYAPVTLRLEHRDGVYQKGETVRVWADVGPDTDASLLLRVTTNGLFWEEKTLSLQEGSSVVLEQSYDKPIWVRLNLGPARDRNIAAQTGFIVAPEEMTPGFPEPEDFMPWWQEQLAAMRAVPAQAKLLAVESPEAGIRVWKLEIPMHEGNPVRGYLAMPDGAAPGSLPIFFYAHPAGSATAAHTHASAQQAASFARKGAISLDINAHGILDDAPAEYYARMDTTELLLYQERPVRDRESYYFRLMFLRLVRALDYLCTLPEWDGKRVLVRGESQGGAQSFALAGLDPRVSAVVATVPAMTDLGGSLQERQCGWPYQLRPMVPLSSHGKAALPYFDGALFLKHYKGELFVEAGLIDVTCPPCAVAAGFNNSAASRKEIHFWPGRGHNYWSDKASNDAWEKIVLLARDQYIDNYLR